MRGIRIDVILVIILTVVLTVYLLSTTTAFGPVASGSWGITPETALVWGQGAGEAASSEADEPEPEAEVTAEPTEEATAEASETD